MFYAVRHYTQKRQARICACSNDRMKTVDSSPSPMGAVACLQATALWGTALGLLAWLLWAVPQSASLAVQGVACLVLFWAVCMVLPFALMHWVNRSDSAPRAHWGQVLRALGAEVGCFFTVFCWRQPLRSRSMPDWLPETPTGQRGVVLVHGFLCNRGLWLPWMPRLRERGHAYVAVNLEPVFGSIDDYIATVEDAVQRVTQATGMPPVIIAHSMGGLATRAWLRAQQADARVHHVVTLGTPHGGTWLGRFSSVANGRQMQLASPWLQRLHLDEPASRAQRFTCWYSNCDNIVFPARTAALPGAQQHFIAGVAHVEMACHPEVVQACLGLLQKSV